MKKYLFASIALLGLGTNLYADCTSKGCYDTVERLFITADGNIYIGTGGDEKKVNCTLAYGKYLTLPASGDAAKAMYSALLTAQTTGKKALIRAKTGSSNCEISYVTIDKG